MSRVAIIELQRILNRYNKNLKSLVHGADHSSGTLKSNLMLEIQDCRYYVAELERGIGHLEDFLGANYPKHRFKDPNYYE